MNVTKKRTLGKKSKSAKGAVSMPTDLTKARQLFGTFSKIGAFTFGGGYAMIPLIQREVTERRRWLEDRDPKPLERLARKLERQDRFHLEGEEYKRSKGESSPVLKPWFNRKSITICTAHDPDERMITPELKADILDGFRWLMPYYRYFKALELEPPVTDRF